MASRTIGGMSSYRAISRYLSGQLDQRPAAGVVDTTDRWKLKSREWAKVRQVMAIDVNVMELGGRQEQEER